MRPFIPIAYLFVFTFSACVTTESVSPPPSPRSTSTISPEGLALETVLPVDENVTVGQLDNGLRYYIRTNDEPQNRAELRLAVNVGSILENDDQQGLAHFIEHMLFNGTQRFPEQELIDFLEYIGMQFGADVNASTSFEETIYMLTIPTDSIEIIHKSFEVLEDWAAYATLSDAEIDKERGVILEEWRLSDQNAQGRLRKRILPVLLYDSRYKDRIPIGKPEIIESAGYDTIRQFYRDWYRPDLMAVVVVGDIDPASIETLIAAHFGSLRTPDVPKKRERFSVPGHEQTLFLIATDAELPYTSFNVYYKKDAEVMETVSDYRTSLVQGLFNSILNDRFAEIARRPDAPFLGASVFRGALIRPAEYHGLGAQVPDDSVLVGLEAVLTEATRVRLHGFTETELERQKQETLRSYQRAYNERMNTNSASYAREYVGHFLEREPIPGIEYELELVQKYLPTIKVGELNTLAASLLAERNRAVIVTMPEKDGLEIPDEYDLEAVIDLVAEKIIQPYVDDVTDLPLLDDIVSSSAVTETRTLDEIGVTDITLDNGVRVIMKPTDFKEDEIRFTSFSPGGTSLVDEDLIMEADYAATLVSLSGIGAFDQTALQKRLQGKVVSVSPYIGELEEGVYGVASPEDLETMFQLIHLYFTMPRSDSAALGMLQNQFRAVLANRSSNPDAVFQDSLQAAMYGNHPRRRLPTIQMVNDMRLDEAARIYRERFADASDFTFIFVGNVDVSQITWLSEMYLGTLPTINRTESWRDVAPDPPSHIVEKIVQKGVGDQSQAVLVFHGPFQFDRIHRHRLRFTSEVLNIMLREELREELGGVYGVSTQASSSGQPDSTYTVFINFSCDPNRVDELITAVFQQIETLQTAGPSDDDVAKVREQQRRERETMLETNQFWVSVLDFYYSNDAEDPLDVLRYFELIDNIEASDIQQAAREYFDFDRYIKAVLYPETYEVQ